MSLSFPVTNRTSFETQGVKIIIEPDGTGYRFSAMRGTEPIRFAGLSDTGGQKRARYQFAPNLPHGIMRLSRTIGIDENQSLDDMYKSKQ